jgi:cytochrome c oxidase subunit 2
MNGMNHDVRHRAWRQVSMLAGGAAAVLIGGIHAALAQQPQPWEMGMQPAHSPVKESIASLNDLVTVIIAVITVFVAGLLGWVMYRYNAQRNPVPSRLSHNTTLEIAWTLIPVLILVVIAVPSFRLVYFEDRTRDPDMTIKVTGHQWYWEFTYPDSANLDFNSYIVPEDKLKPGQKRLLDVDNQLVLPAGKRIRILTTSGDVIHSFFIPSLGVQRYAIPGRSIETWVQIDKPGDYYGECNQICGVNHSQMPISIHAVSPAEFNAWLTTAKTKFAARDVAPADAAPLATARAAGAAPDGGAADSVTGDPRPAAGTRALPAQLAQVESPPVVVPTVAEMSR